MVLVNEIGCVSVVVESNGDNTFEYLQYGLQEDDVSDGDCVVVERFARLRKEDPVCGFETEWVNAFLKKRCEKRCNCFGVDFVNFFPHRVRDLVTTGGRDV